MIEPCLWDSEFFGYTVGRKHIAEGESADYDAIMTEAEEAGVRLLYLFSFVSMKIAGEFVLSYLNIKKKLF